MVGAQFCLSMALVFGVIVCVSGVPVQGGMNANTLRRIEEYSRQPSNVAELLNRYFEERGNEVGPTRGLDSFSASGRLFRQTRHGLDPLSGATFGESKRFPAASRKSMSGRSLEEADRYSKRNIDEIDRTAFDSFFKRNFDEIDRVGWSGFVKRLDDGYMNEKQR